MELLTFTMAANETKEFRKAGRYLEIIDSTYAINLLFIGDDGNQTDDAIGALSGIFIEESYAAFQVKNGPTAQSITLLVHDGRGGSRRQPGNVSIIDAVSRQCQLYSVVGQTAIGVTVTPMVLPAQNLKGCNVRQSLIELTAGSGGFSNARVIAAETAPAVFTPTGVPALLLNSLFNPTTTISSSALFDTRRLVPPGWGIYFVTSHAAVVATTASALASIEILQ